MKSASRIVDPSQTYESLVLEQDLVLTADDGAVKIPRTSREDTYDLVGGAYSNHKPPEAGA